MPLLDDPVKIWELIFSGSFGVGFDYFLDIFYLFQEFEIQNRIRSLFFIDSDYNGFPPQLLEVFGEIHPTLNARTSRRRPVIGENQYFFGIFQIKRLSQK